jgi:hypothetical protein
MEEITFIAFFFHVLGSAIGFVIAIALFWFYLNILEWIKDKVNRRER